MKTIGTELSVDLFSPATWTAHSAESYAGADYPFLRPEGSWRLDCEGELHGVDPAGSGWRDRDTGEHVDLAGRRFVLAYGSNPNPHKLLAETGFPLEDGVIALRAAVFGWASVWCDARRGDGTVVATLAEIPGRVEVHPVFALTQDQVTAMDIWEGHPRYYRRSRHAGPIQWESGRWAADDVEVYLGDPQRRPILLVDGCPLACADVSYGQNDGLVD